VSFPIRRIVLAGALIAAGGLAWFAPPYVQSAATLLQLDPVDGIATDDLEVPTRDGRLAARVYRPRETASAHVILFPGIQAGGFDEPRLEALASRLAGAGALVVSVPLPDLRAFRVSGRSTDMIEDATRWMSDQPTLAPDGRVGVVGISFAGGLALVAAGRPTLAGRLSAVVTVGSHGDLPRVMRYLCTGRLPAGQVQRPHDYGVAVLALAAAGLLVPPAQSAGLAEAIEAFLRASSLQAVEPARSASMLADAVRQADGLPEPARGLARLVIARDVEALGPRLLPFVDALGADPALSPERSPATNAPVFLLHGPRDDVIPTSELASLAADLAARGQGPVRSIVTPILRHADLDRRLGVLDGWAMLRFWTTLRAALER
jgi:dienelactone hydrolase